MSQSNILCVVTVCIAALTCSYFIKSTSGTKHWWKRASSVYEFTANDSQGFNISLEKYRGKVLIIVNVASESILSEQYYKELVILDQKYRETRDLCILAFPCNQFGEEEPKEMEDILNYASKFNVKFEIFQKVKVNGIRALALFRFLKYKQKCVREQSIKWNFARFIVDRNGMPVRTFSPSYSPLAMEKALLEYL